MLIGVIIFLHPMSTDHYGHRRIIQYCDRPFSSIHAMDNEIINRHNEVVHDNDIVIHGGDFTLLNNARDVVFNYIKRLNGTHIFLKGSHDYWLRPDKTRPHIWEKTVQGQHIVICHYAMRVWPRSHYNSWQLYGHSHGGLAPQGKQWDIGVDNNNFYPVSFEKLVEIMKDRPDNFNLVRR